MPTMPTNVTLPGRLGFVSSLSLLGPTAAHSSPATWLALDHPSPLSLRPPCACQLLESWDAILSFSDAAIPSRLPSVPGGGAGKATPLFPAEAHTATSVPPNTIYTVLCLAPPFTEGYGGNVTAA